MTPEQLREHTAKVIEESTALIQQAVDQAELASTAWASGNFREYWQNVGEQAKRRVDDRYDEAKPDVAGDESPVE